MKIYIAHSRAYDYQAELYDPIRGDSNLPNSEIILPHEPGRNSENNRKFYQELDLVIAEVSYPATGLGIELGWAFDSRVPIICLYKEGVKVSGSLQAVSNQFYRYGSQEELLQNIEKIIKKHHHGHQ